MTRSFAAEASGDPGGSGAFGGAAAAPVRMDPLFIVGYKRSGTTMLRLLLSAHPEVAIPPESEYFQKIPRLLGRRTLDAEDLEPLLAPLASLRRCDFGLHLTVHELREVLAPVLPADGARLLARLYQHWAEHIGKPAARWGDKKPQHWQFIYRLRRWYPASQFVHLVRDPRDVIASIEQHFPEQVRGRQVVPAHVISAWQWRLAEHETMRQGSLLGRRRYMALRYEQLVQEPERHARRLCAFLHLPFDPLMLSFHEQVARDGERLQDGLDGLHRQTTREVHPGRVGRANRQLTAAQRGDIEYICADLFDLHGWARSAAPPGPGRRAWLDAVCRTLDAAWRMRRTARRARGSL